MMGRYHEALQPLGKAIQLNPRFGGAFYNLAAAYAHLRDKGNVIKWLNKAILLDPALASEAQRDDDFKSLHSDPDFLAITQHRTSR